MNENMADISIKLNTKVIIMIRIKEINVKPILNSFGIWRILDIPNQNITAEYTENILMKVRSGCKEDMPINRIEGKEENVMSLNTWINCFSHLNLGRISLIIHAEEKIMETVIAK